jgi:hypothetical protein
MFDVLLKNNETWLVCGGRDFAEEPMFHDVMRRLVDMWGMPERIVEGACPTGADLMAKRWAQQYAIDIGEIAPDWEGLGKAAGPIRNEEMLMKYKPQRVIAFPGGRGTADMVARARRRNSEITVIEVKPN